MIGKTTYSLCSETIRNIDILCLAGKLEPNLSIIIKYAELNPSVATRQ